jgi:hypothetical protein
MHAPLRTHLTANSLNSAVYSCLGIFNIPNLHFVYPIQRPLADKIREEAHLRGGAATFSYTMSVLDDDVFGVHSSRSGTHS